MALFDLIGRRWTLRIVFELHQSERPLKFRELRQACGDVSSSVLTRRLHELTDAHISTHTGEGYALTLTGQALVANLRPILRWANEWSQELATADSDNEPDED